MNFKTTVILLVLLLGAATYVVIDRIASRNRDTVETAPNPSRLFDVKDKDDVTSLTIKPADGSEIRLEKQADNKWRMTKPVEAPAESWQVDGLVRELVELESRREVDPVKEMGLDTPRFRIEIAAKGGKNLRLAVGDKSPLNDTVFVRVENKPKADVVPASVYEQLSKPYNELRDKQLVTTPSMQINQLVVQYASQKLTMQKRGAQWQLVEPVQMPADEAVMTDLLGAVTGLRAAEWVAKDSAEVGRAQLDKPQMTVSFTTAAPATQPATAPVTAPASQPVWTTITFGQFEDARAERVYARLSDSPAVVKVAATPLDTLRKKPLDIRDKKLLDIIPEQVSKLSIVTDVPSPAPTTKPSKHAEVALERRKEVAPAVPATQTVAAKPAGPTTKPAATQIAATQPTTRPATQLAGTAPTTQPASTQAAAPPPSIWVLKTPPGGDADDNAVREVLDEIHPLRVSKYLESTPTTRPAANYVLRLTTEGPGGTPVYNYQITLSDPGGEKNLIGEFNGQPFELPHTFVKRLEGDFVRKKDAQTTQPKANPADFTLPGE
jgi:hypothetical protein